MNDMSEWQHFFRRRYSSWPYYKSYRSDPLYSVGRYFHEGIFLLSMGLEFATVITGDLLVFPCQLIEKLFGRLSVLAGVGKFF